MRKTIVVATFNSCQSSFGLMVYINGKCDLTFVYVNFVFVLTHQQAA